MTLSHAISLVYIKCLEHSQCLFPGVFASEPFA
jgi:hypothetical protein